MFLFSDFSNPTPLSHLFPDMNLSPFPKLFIVNKQLLEHFLHLVVVIFNFIKLIDSLFNKDVSYPYSYFSFAIILAPKAPIIPAILGLTTSLSVNISNTLKTASL